MAANEVKDPSVRDATAAVIHVMRERDICQPKKAVVLLLAAMIRACPDWGLDFEECLLRARNETQR